MEGGKIREGRKKLCKEKEGRGRKDSANKGKKGKRLEDGVIEKGKW